MQLDKVSIIVVVAAVGVCGVGWTLVPSLQDAQRTVDQEASVHIERARRLSGPSIPAMRSSLPNVGDSISAICYELERDLTVERLDAALVRFKAATQNLIQLRQALEIERQGTG